MRLLAILPLLLVATPMVLAGLALLGTPSACVDRAVAADAASEPLAARWDAFVQQAATGGATSFEVTEAQATALASQWAAEQTLPISDVRVIFCPDGQADVATRITMFGWSVDALARAAIDTSGTEPRARIASVQVGGVPSMLTSSLAGMVLGSAMNDLPLPPGATVKIEDGRAVISGRLPR